MNVPAASGEIVLAATRVWVPVAIAIAGVVGIVIGHGTSAAAGAGVGLVIVGADRVDGQLDVPA